MSIEYLHGAIGLDPVVAQDPVKLGTLLHNCGMALMIEEMRLTLYRNELHCLECMRQEKRFPICVTTCPLNGIPQPCAAGLDTLIRCFNVQTGDHSDRFAGGFIQ